MDSLNKSFHKDFLPGRVRIFPLLAILMRLGGAGAAQAYPEAFPKADIWGLCIAWVISLKHNLHFDV